MVPKVKNKIILVVIPIILIVGSLIINPSISIDSNTVSPQLTNRGSGNVLTNSVNKAQAQIHYKYWTYITGKGVVNDQPAFFWYITFYLQINPLDSNGSSTSLNTANITFLHPNHFIQDSSNPGLTYSSNTEYLYYTPAFLNESQVKYPVPDVKITPYDNHESPAYVTWLLQFNHNAKKDQTGIYFQMNLIDFNANVNETFIDNCSISVQSSAGTFNTIIVPFYVSLNTPNSNPSIYTVSVSNQSTPSNKLITNQLLMLLDFGMIVFAVSYLYIFYKKKRR